MIFGWECKNSAINWLISDMIDLCTYFPLVSADSLSPDTKINKTPLESGTYGVIYTKYSCNKVPIGWPSC